MSVTITTIDWSQNQDGSPSAAFLKAVNRITRECEEGIRANGYLATAEAIVQGLAEEDFVFPYGYDPIEEHGVILAVFNTLTRNEDLLSLNSPVLAATSVAEMLVSKNGLRPKS